MVVRCLRSNEHHSHKLKNRNRLLGTPSGLVEVNIMTGKPNTPITTGSALALPSTTEGMLERVQQAGRLAMFERDLNRDQALALAQYALSCGLDPIGGEVTLIHGKPYATIKAWRRKQSEAGHHPTFRYEFMGPEERAEFERLGLLGPQDLVGYCYLLDEQGREHQGFAKITRRELDQPNRSGDGYANPVLRANPIEVWRKRGEMAARHVAYGPPLPAMSRVADAGQLLDGGEVVIGEARWLADDEVPLLDPEPPTGPAGRRSGAAGPGDTRPSGRRSEARTPTGLPPQGNPGGVHQGGTARHAGRAPNSSGRPPSQPQGRSDGMAAPTDPVAPADAGHNPALRDEIAQVRAFVLANKLTPVNQKPVEILGSSISAYIQEYGLPATLAKLQGYLKSRVEETLAAETSPRPMPPPRPQPRQQSFEEPPPLEATLEDLFPDAYDTREN
jgi:hypothetical protein